MKRRRVVISDSSSSDNDEGDDLDKELLNLATRNKRNQAPTLSEKKSKEKYTPASDSGTSDSGEEWGDRKKPQRKKAASSAAKKSKAMVSSSDSDGEDDEEHNSEPEEGELTSEESSGEEFDDGYDENLMGDDEDKAKLEEMTEKEREQVIYERMERRDAMRTRWGIKRKLKKENKKQKAKKKVDLAAAAKKATTSSRQQRTAEKRTEGKKAQAIQDLKAKREEKKQRQEQKQKGGEEKVDDDRDDDSTADGTEGDEGKEGEVKKQPLKASDIYSDDDDDDEDSKSSASSSKSESDSESDDGADSNRVRKDKPVEYVSTSAHLNKIRLSRHKLEKWCHAPFFKDVVVGCFVRVGIGQHIGKSVYRACNITDVVETAKIYCVGNNRTNKGLKLKFGKAERVFRLEFISNDNITEHEFAKLQHENEMAGVSMPTVDFVEQKCKELAQYIHYKFTDEDVEHIVREKSRFRNKPFNYATKKADLLQQKVEAECENDMEEMRRIEGELEELENRASEIDRLRNENTFNVIYINKKNRLRNVLETEKAMRKEAQEARQQKQDPFTRRKCKPILVQNQQERAKQPNKGQSNDSVDSNRGDANNSSATTTGAEEDVVSMIAKSADLNKSKPVAAKLTNSVYAKKSNQSLSAASDVPTTTAGVRSQGSSDNTRGNSLERDSLPATDLSSVHSFDLDIPLKFDLDLQPPMHQVKINPIGLGSMQKHGLNLEEFKKKKGLI